MFRFDPPTHPEFGTEPVKHGDWLYGTVGIEKQPDGSYDYDGSGTDMFWDCTQPEFDNDSGKWTLIDEDGNFWEADVYYLKPDGSEDLVSHDRTPRVLVEVRGGIAEVSATPGVAVHVIDYDNNPDAKMPEEFEAAKPNLIPCT